MSSNNSVATSTTASVSTAATGASVRFRKKIFMDISPSTSKAKLYLLADQCGQVTSLHIAKNGDGQSRGFAFVTFRWHEDAVVAIEELEGSVLDGMILHPRWAFSKKPGKKEGKPKRNGSRRKRSDKAMAAK